MNPNLTYTDATPEDAPLLSATAFRSKKHWGYPDGLMLLWTPDLTVTADYIRDNKVVKAFDGQRFIGFFAIKAANGNAELDHLWLAPEHIKKQYGSAIFRHAAQYLAGKGYSRMTLVAEPNATGFYEKMDGKVIGKFQSKISGRFLDIYEFRI